MHTNKRFTLSVHPLRATIPATILSCNNLDEGHSVVTFNLGSLSENLRSPHLSSYNNWSVSILVNIKLGGEGVAVHLPNRWLYSSKKCTQKWRKCYHFGQIGTSIIINHDPQTSQMSNVFQQTDSLFPTVNIVPVLPNIAKLLIQSNHFDPIYLWLINQKTLD